MKKTIKNNILVLASQSPRRKELLSQAGFEFEIIPSQFDEDGVKITKPDNYVKILSEAKALDIAEKYPENWVIGADTIVLIDGEILGKPGSIDEARKMLNKLSGNTHQVFTGFTVCCKSKKRVVSEVVKTDVVFKKLTRDEIEWYINTDEPYDKAGSYAIQGLGSFMVKSINGSYSNVVGLPVCEVIQVLKNESAVEAKNGMDSYTII